MEGKGEGAAGGVCVPPSRASHTRPFGERRGISPRPAIRRCIQVWAQHDTAQEGKPRWILPHLHIKKYIIWTSVWVRVTVFPCFLVCLCGYYRVTCIRLPLVYLSHSLQHSFSPPTFHFSFLFFVPRHSSRQTPTTFSQTPTFTALEPPLTVIQQNNKAEFKQSNANTSCQLKCLFSILSL